jgi:hypothetical protein
MQLSLKSTPAVSQNPDWLPWPFVNPDCVDVCKSEFPPANKNNK